MKPIATGLWLLLMAAPLAYGKAYFAPKLEMIAKSDVIAIVEITQVKSLEPQKRDGDQMAKATVQEVLKGDVQKKTEVEFRVRCFYPCAVTQVSTGLHLVFLAGKEKELKGNNWHLSYRPIKDGKLDWYQDGTSLALEPRPLGEVLDDVRKLLKDQLSHGDTPPAPAPEVKAPSGAQAVAPDGKMRVTETQAKDVAVARNHTILHAEMVTVYSDVHRGLEPLSEASAKERAIRWCESDGKMNANVVISIVPSQNHRDYFKVIVQGRRGEEIVTESVLIHRFNAKGDRFERETPPATQPGMTQPLPPAEPALQLRIDPKKLALFNLSLADVRKALAEQKIAVAGERVSAAGQHELDLDPGRIPKAEDLRRIVIKTPAGLSVPLESLAEFIPVAGDGAAPTQPAAARQPAAKAAQRAEGLKRTQILHVELQYFGPEPENRMGLLLHSDEAKYAPGFLAAQAWISPEQRGKIIDHLAVEGFLDRAGTYDMAELRPQGPTYLLRVRWGKGFYAEDLGWNPDMLLRLDGLRKVLDGEAGEAMDQVLEEVRNNLAPTREAQSNSEKLLPEGGQFTNEESVRERMRDEERKLLREEGKKTPNGQRDGPWRFYGPEGQLIAEGTYHNGTIANGTIAQVRHFKDDRPLELWRTTYGNGMMTKFEKYVAGKWCTAKYAYCIRHDYRGKEWAGSVGWSDEIVLQESQNPPERVADAIWAAAQKKVELSLRGDTKTTHAFLVQDPVRDTPGVASQEEFAAGTKRKIEKFDGRTWSQVSQAEIERLGKPGSDTGNSSKESGDTVPWGEPTNGLQAGLSLKSTSREPRVSAILAFHLRNAGDKPVRILKLAAQARFFGEYLPLEIRSSGTILKYQGPLLTPPQPPNESDYITLNPGDADSTEVTFVPEYWKLAVPFEVQAVFVFKQTLGEEKTVGPYDQEKKQWKTVGGLWRGEARSQAVTVKMGATEQGAWRPAAAAQSVRLKSDYVQAKRLARVFSEAASGKAPGVIDRLIQEGQSNLPGLVSLVEIGDERIQESSGLRQCEQAAVILGHIGDRRAIPCLLDRLWRTDKPEWRLITALGELGAEEVVPDLVAWLYEDRYWDVNSQAYGSAANYMLEALQKVTGRNFGADVSGRVDANAQNQKTILAAIDVWWASQEKQKYVAAAAATVKPDGTALLVLHALNNSQPVEQMDATIGSVIGQGMMACAAVDRVEVISSDRSAEVYVSASTAPPRTLLANVRKMVQTLGPKLPGGTDCRSIDVLGPRAKVPPVEIRQVDAVEFVIDRQRAAEAGISVAMVDSLVESHRWRRNTIDEQVKALKEARFPVAEGIRLESLGRIRIVKKPSHIVRTFPPATPPANGSGSDKPTDGKPPAGAQPPAAFAPLAPKVDPLPQAEVGVLFKKTEKGEKIELIKLYQALKGPQTALRAEAASELGKYGDKSSVPYLIDALSDESTHVGARYVVPGMETTRYRANDSLRKLTGQDFGFVWNDPVENRNNAITRWREWFNREKVTDPIQEGQIDSEKQPPPAAQPKPEDPAPVREPALEEESRRLLAAEQAELARGVAERDQRTAMEHARADEMAAANQKAEQAKAAIAPEFIAKIKAMLPDGWSVATEKDVLTIRRDEKVEADYMSPVGMMPEQISTSDVFRIRVGPRISVEQYAPMAEENRKVLEDFRAKHPNYSPIEYRIELPHVLPTHFDEQHSLWISSKLLRGFIEFKSKEVFDECSRTYAGVEGMFYHYSDTKGGVAKSPLLSGVIALRNAEELAEAIRRRMPANWRVVNQRVVDWSAGDAANWPRGRGKEIVIQRQGFQPLDLKYGRGGQVVLAVLETGYTPPDPATVRAAQMGNAAYLGPWLYPGVFGMVFGGNDWPTAKADIQAAMIASKLSQPPSAGSIRIGEVQGFADRLSGITPANWEVASIEHRETGGPGWPKGDALVIGLQRKGITAAERERRRGGTLTLAVMLGEFTPAEPVGDAQVMAARQWGACEGHAVFAVFGGQQDWPNMEQDVRGLLEVATPPANGSGSEKPDAARQASIAGSVESLPAKEPVANARVVIQGTTTNGKSWSLESKTDTEGRFLVEAVPPERPVVVVVSKVMEGMGWFQVQAETTLTPGEKRNLRVLRAGVKPPPLATPDNAQNLEAHYRRVSAIEANYRRAIETEGQTTSPYYVLVRVVNDGTRESRTVCVEPSQLLRALCMEMNLTATAEGLEKAKEAALKQADRVFRFSNREALALAQPRYTEAILTEVRQYLKNGSTQDAVKQIMDQSSALYRFCNKTEGSLHAYLDAVAHVFMESAMGKRISPKHEMIAPLSEM